MTVYQVIYMSAETVPFNDEALAELLKIARANNEPKDVSGLLVYHKGSFLQVLEGDRQTVKETFDFIGLDTRHKDVQVLFEGEVEERSFGGWSMGYMPSGDLSDVPEGFHPFLVSGFRKNDETPSMARRAMLAFKGGRWRANIAA